MSNRDKGQRREKEVRELYERAGYAVESPNYTRYENTDYFNLFDFMAIRPDRKPRFVQVKSNHAGGISAWMDSVRAFFPGGHVEIDYVVVYDREGVRLDKPVWDDEPAHYMNAVDGRDVAAQMGDPIVEYLSNVKD